ncbi:hypothetical protein [Bdellovibrio sp. HCB274]|uniref:hypothetical protein n=1 Tax=Bdellovibrio sp. HCB274 TaxID=3394361 RepID=UPI0039B4ECD7
MRKIIETTSTLALWVVFIVGSSLAVFDFFYNKEESLNIINHLTLISLSPLFAVCIFVGMLIVVRFSNYKPVKKTIPCEHAVQWSEFELAQARSGKVVDLHFPAAGLACQVMTRNEVAQVLHSENQTVHVTVTSQHSEEPALALLPQAF